MLWAAFSFLVILSNRASGNPEIDKFIQEQQLKATDNYKVLEQIGEGGFAKVYKARWTGGPVFNWNTVSNRWERGPALVARIVEVVLLILSVAISQCEKMKLFCSCISSVLWYAW